MMKWRPPLALVLGCTILSVLGLSYGGIVAVRYLFPVIGYQEAVVVTGLVVLALAGVVGWVLWRVLLRPITALAAQADAVRRGDGRLEPPAHHGTAEMFRMGEAVRAMGRSLQSREAVLRSYADHVTHEMRGPLTVLRGAAELLSDPALTEDDRAALTARIDGAAARMEALIAAQRALARAHDPVAPGTAWVSDVLPEGASLSRDGVVPLPVEVLRAVLSHLVGNALAHGARTVTVAAEPDRLTVADDGPGVSEGNADRIFEPFFTTRRETGGTGMGLSIVRRMLEAQGAAITLEAPGPGARFVIRWPDAPGR